MCCDMYGWCATRYRRIVRHASPALPGALGIRAVNLAFALPVLAVLVVALFYVRRVAHRQRQMRTAGRRTSRTGRKAPPTTQRSDMRSGESTISLMDAMQRTQSGSIKIAPVRKAEGDTPSRDRQ
jgi:hypothetical protein